MKKQPLSDWLTENFTRPPCPATARKWCEKGQINAEKIGANWYVIVNDSAPKISKRDERLNKILSSVASN